MTTAEHRLLLQLLWAILLSVPLALLAYRFVFPQRRATPPPLPVIPPAAAVVPLSGAVPEGPYAPPAACLVVVDEEPVPYERGVPVRHWKGIDGVAALILTGLLCVLMGPLSISPEAAEELELTPGMMTFQIVFQLGVAGLVLLYLRLRGLPPVRVFGFRRLGAGKTIGFALIGFVVAYVLVILAAVVQVMILGEEAVQNGSKQMIVEAFMKGMDPVTTVLYCISVAIGAPIMEEIVFRGFLYPVTKRFTHMAYAVPAVAMFFAVVHGNVLSFVPLTCIALVLVAAYELTRSLAVPMIIHGLFNLTQSVLMFYAKDLEELQKSLQHGS